MWRRMCSRIFILCLVSAVLVQIQFSESAPVASTYQFLPPKQGYIPVYIRKGDTPLEEINLELAEAFKSLESRTSHEKVPQDKSQYVLTGIVEDGKTKIDYVPRINDILKNIANEK